jgi:hypothetical protein
MMLTPARSHRLACRNRSDCSSIRGLPAAHISILSTVLGFYVIVYCLLSGRARAQARKLVEMPTGASIMQNHARPADIFQELTALKLPCLKRRDCEQSLAERLKGPNLLMNCPAHIDALEGYRNDWSLSPGVPTQISIVLRSSKKSVHQSSSRLDDAPVVYLKRHVGYESKDQ